MGRIEVHVSAPSFVLLSVLVLVIPLRWLSAVFFSVLLHESCHAAMILLLGERIESVCINTGGVVMHTTSMPPWKEILCAAAGPGSCLLPLLFIRHFPLVALCSLVHSAFNLLPLYPLDGGRILRQLFLNKQKAFLATQLLLGTAVILLGGFLSVDLKLGVLPATMAFMGVMKTLQENFLAKKTK